MMMIDSIRFDSIDDDDDDSFDVSFDSFIQPEQSGTSLQALSFRTQIVS